MDSSLTLMNIYVKEGMKQKVWCNINDSVNETKSEIKNIVKISLT